MLLCVSVQVSLVLELFPTFRVYIEMLVMCYMCQLMGLELALEWENPTTLLAFEVSLFVLILVTSKRKLIVKCFMTDGTVHYPMGLLVVGGEFLC